MTRARQVVSPRRGTAARDAGPWPGAVLEIRERTASTMDDAHRLALAGCAPGSAAAAGWQDRGRGRVPGRAWLSPPWESLLVTVVLRRPMLPFALGELPLRAGLAAARAVESTAGLDVRVRWPNDLLVRGRKLAGLLCEARGAAILVGLGVNCLQRSFPAGLATPACSLATEGRTVAPGALLGPFLRELAGALRDPGWRSALENRLHGLGGPARVDLLGSGETVSGTIRGVDGEGRLLLELPAGIRAIAQGEISPGR